MIYNNGIFIVIEKGLSSKKMYSNQRHFYFQAFPQSMILPSLARRPHSLPTSVKGNSAAIESIRKREATSIRDVPKEVREGIMCNVKGCAQVFRNRFALMAHQLDNSHIGYECPLCESPGSTKGVVRRHINSVHGGQRHTCEVCGRTFSRTDTLRDHVNKSHNSGK